MACSTSAMNRMTQSSRLRNNNDGFIATCRSRTSAAPMDILNSQRSEKMADSFIWKFTDSICSRVDDAIELIRDLIERLEQNGWSDRDVFGIHMAMEESLMNAIKHGNGSDCSKKILVEIEVTDSRFYAKITDDGNGFDPVEVPDPTSDENLEKTSGRGVMLIRNFVDEVKYSDKGNSVELIKSKSSAR